MDNKLNLAATQLSQLLSLYRSFLRTASDAIFHVSPIVNFDMYYQPMFIELKQAGFSDWDIFGDSLNPLTFDDISMNRLWLMMFTQGTRTLQFKHIANKAQDTETSLYGFQAQSKHKENMTLHSMFEYQKLQLIPKDAQKINLLSIVKNVDVRAKAHSEK